MARLKVRRPSPGTVLRIPLGAVGVGYGRVLDDPRMAFYALGEDVGHDLESLLLAPAAFAVWVSDEAFSSGTPWTVTGLLPLSSDEAADPYTSFIQDAITGALRAYQVTPGESDAREWPISYGEAVLLERASVWDREHVEERLRDHLAGQPCRWVEPPYDPDAASR